MAKLEKYNGSVQLMAGITQKGGGDFALVDANAVQTREDGTRLDDELAEIKNSIDNIPQSDSVVLTQEEYDGLRADGRLVATTKYFIYEEVIE